MLRPELTERILRLRTMPILTSLPTSELAALAQTMRSQTFDKGQTILAEDEQPRAMYLVRTGVATMRRHGKRIGTVRGPGGVGFMSALARTAGGTATVADTRVEAYEVPIDALEEIFEDHFVVLLKTIRLVAERLVKLMMEMEPPPYVPPQVAYEHLIGDRELGIVERIFLMRRARAFAAANVNSLATLARAMEEVRVPAGTVLWSAGAPSRESYMIVKGMARLTWNDGQRVQTIGPGYVIGGSETLVGLPRWNEFKTDEALVALKGTESGLLDLFEDDHDLALRFLSMLATYLLTLQDQKAEMGLASVGAGPYQSERALAVASASASSADSRAP